MISPGAARLHLEERRATLRRLGDNSNDARQPVQLDQSKVGRLSRMDALQAQAMSLAMGRRRKVELARIEAALRRIDAGTFGECVSCAGDIAPRRLQFDPATPVCIDCAQDADS